MVSANASSSVCKSIRPRRVNRPRGRSRMWVAWTSEKSNGVACSASRAAPRFSEARIKAMISSIMSIALRRP